MCVGTYVCQHLLCTTAKVHDNTVCICVVLCGEIGGLILLMWTHCTYFD